MYDLIIKNGWVIDGTGSPAFRSDVAIKNGKIAHIGRKINGEAKECIDATGLTVTPGFIDSHSHSDNKAFTYPEMIEKIEQGITTSVGGQCGSTLAPSKGKVTDENAMEIVMDEKEKEKFRTFGNMVRAAEEVPLGSNLMSFVGHGALRKATVGFENRKPTADEMEKMKELLRDAMENGAVGLSFGLIYTPSCYAETDELIELAKVVKEYEGVISAHIRNEGFELNRAVEEFLTVVKTVDVKAVISHHKAMYKENWSKVNNTLRMIEDAVKDGYDVYCDVYPYIASQTGLAPTIIAPEMRDTDTDGIVEMLSDPEMREKIRREYSSKYDMTLSDLQITYCGGFPEYEGRRINELAAELGKDPFDMALDLIRDTRVNVGVCKFVMCEADLETVLKFERTMVCTDASVAGTSQAYHPRLRGTFPRVLGRYVRERGVTTLHNMIRKCTSMPASVYGLGTKGVLKEGLDADICIFDAERIIDKAGFTDCHKHCEGLNYVVLDGEIVVENAVYNGKTPGRFIKVQR